MNKDKIEQLLPYAEQVWESQYGNKPIKSTFRGYISSFGAAIATGSLLAAVSFYSNEKHRAEGERQNLPQLILSVLKLANPEIKDLKLSDYVKSMPNKALAKHEVIHATIALKLAMNLFEIEDTADE